MDQTNNVSEAIASAALLAVAAHPLHVEATAWAHCPSDVFRMPKNFVERARISEDERKFINEALEGVSTVLMVGYWTAEKKPEPLAGSGKLYAFLVHPETFAVIHAGVSTWRS